jgi:rubrerythrin
MTSERDKTLEGLRAAIQMETDGKAFYLDASKHSSNEAGRKLLETLSGEEDFHRQRFETIFRAISDRQDWPDVDPEPGRVEGLKTVFALEAERATVADPAPTEMDAIQTAMTMENRTYDFYAARSRDSTRAAEKEFYDAVAAQERIHHRLLRDYYEYLEDPAQWYANKEHPSLDAG